VNEAISSVEAYDSLQRFNTASTRCDRMVADRDEHYQRAEAENKTGHALSGPARKMSWAQRLVHATKTARDESWLQEKRRSYR
jgi:hypothetical protein